MTRPQISDPVQLSTRRPFSPRADHLQRLRAAVSKAATTSHSVLMVGTSLSARGGIRAVVQGYVDAGLMDRVPCQYVSTHCDGSSWDKTRCAITGWVRVAVLLFKMDSPLVHIHLASRASFWRKSVITLLARAARRPYVLHVHGGQFIPFYESQHKLLKHFVRSVFENAAMVIALSEPMRAMLVKNFQLRDIEVVPNAVSIPAAPVKRIDEGQTLLFLGHLQKDKGAFDLVRAFARIAERFPDLKLVCAGTGAIAQARAQAERLGVLDRVSFPGWVDKQARDRALAAATIFVLPSYAEGLPMALLEAMSCGVPVVATPVGGIPQLIEHDVNGVLVKPGQIDALAAAIAALLSDPQKQERLGRCARLTVQGGYAIDSVIEKLYSIYNRFGVVCKPATHEEPVKIARSAS